MTNNLGKSNDTISNPKNHEDLDSPMENQIDTTYKNIDNLIEKGKKDKQNLVNKSDVVQKLYDAGLINTTQFLNLRQEISQKISEINKNIQKEIDINISKIQILPLSLPDNNEYNIKFRCVDSEGYEHTFEHTFSVIDK